MRKIKFVALLLSLLPLLAYAESLTVEISELNENTGQILIGLYNNADNFPIVNKAYKGIFTKVEQKEIHYTFLDMPSGNYALAVIHDVNNNGELDKNLLGIPVEGYGFSNNPTTNFGTPNFNEAKFHFDSASTIKIKIKY